jgi:hypothetical protein
MIIGLAYILYSLDWGIYRLVQFDLNLELASTLLSSSILSTLCLVDIRFLGISILVKAFVIANCNPSCWLFRWLPITNIDSISIGSSMGVNSLKSSVDIRVGCHRRWRSTVAIWVAITPNPVTAGF